jgi:hypothetical protein
MILSEMMVSSFQLKLTEEPKLSTFLHDERFFIVGSLKINEKNTGLSVWRD